MLTSTITHDDTTTTVSIAGRLNSETCGGLESECAGLNYANVIIVNLSDLDYISSAGLRSLVILAKQSFAKGGRFMLVAAKPMVKEVLEISGFLKIMSYYDSMELAKEAL